MGGALWWLTPRNRVLCGAALSALWPAAIARVSGRRLAHVLPAFALQSAVAVTLLEAVNYVEHYALLRKRTPSGDYEAVDPTHSWNSPHMLSNTLLVKLQRHSDHHAFATRPYDLLRNFKESPQLPSGYPGMVVCAFCPPAWRWVMDPYADAVNSGKGTDAARVEAERKMRVVAAAGFATLGAAAAAAYSPV